MDQQQGDYPALSVKELAKVYRNGVQALKSVDLDVHQGNFFALLGPNGAGKSTLIGILTSLVNKSSGSVRVFGHCLDTQRGDVKKCIGVVPQEFNFSLFENVHQIVSNQGGYYGIPRELSKKRAEIVLRQLHLWDKRYVQSRSLSGGMKRRLMIARAMVHDPKLLILDEPTAGVDIELRRSMWEYLQTLNESGTTIVLTTHYLEEAENLCRNIAIIDQGKIVENTTMSALLGKMNKETFILDPQESISLLPKSKEFVLKQNSEGSIEVEVNKEQNLNDLFAFLSKHQISVKSMRNKANRLEELFLGLVTASSHI